MLLFLSILGIFLSLIMLYFNARKYKSSLYLGLFFLFTSLYGFYQYLLLYSKSVTLISIFLFDLPIFVSPVYLIGPMLFLYTRSVLTDQSKLKKSDLWHFLPMLIYFISALPNAFVNWQEKVEAAKMVTQDKEYIMIYKTTLLSEILPAAAIYLIRLFLVLGYTLGSIALFINYLVKKKSSAVLSKQQFMKKWLCYLLGLLLILVVSQIFLVKISFEKHFSNLFITFSVIRIISGIGLTGLVISPFFFPSILYGLPRMPEINEHKDDRQTNETKQLTNFFKSEYLKTIGQKSKTIMEEQQLYLESNCNLAYFSNQIDIPAHHLAYYFREIKKQHFNDYRNEWRINHAKALIEKGKTNEITLEAIGSMSGFSSRNAFLIGFKKVEGISPSAYASRFNS